MKKVVSFGMILWRDFYAVASMLPIKEFLAVAKQLSKAAVFIFCFLLICWGIGSAIHNFCLPETAKNVSGSDSVVNLIVLGCLFPLTFASFCVVLYDTFVVICRIFRYFKRAWDNAV